jgi:plasmid maintenance system antidote protein VapI
MNDNYDDNENTDTSRGTPRVENNRRFVYSKGSSAFTTLADRKKKRTKSQDPFRFAKTEARDEETYDRYEARQEMSPQPQTSALHGGSKNLSTEDLLDLAKQYGIKVPMKMQVQENYAVENEAEESEVESEVVNPCENTIYMNFDAEKLLDENDCDILKTIMRSSNGAGGENDNGVDVLSCLEDETKLNEYIEQIRKFYTKLSSNHYENIDKLNHDKHRPHHEALNY